MRSGTACAAFLLAVSLPGCLLGGPGTPMAPPVGGSPCEDAWAPVSAGWPPHVAATPPTLPLSARFDVCDPEAFFGAGSRAVLEVVVGSPGGRVTTGVRLPPGVEVVSGSLASDGVLDAGTHTFEAVLRGSPGAHRLTAWAEMPAWAIHGSRMADAPSVVVQGSAASAAVKRDVWCCAPLGIEVRLSAAAENPSEVEAVVSAPVAWSGHAHLWTGAESVEPGEDVRFALAAGEELRLRGTVRLPEEFVRQEDACCHQAWAYVYPDASLSVETAAEDVYFGMAGGRLVVLEELPEEAA